MATCVVSGTFLDPSETAISGATVRYVVDTPFIGNTAAIISPKEVSTTTATDGTWSLTLTQSSSGTLSLDCPPNGTNSARTYTFGVVVPATSTASFISVWADPSNFTAPSNFPLTFAMISGQLATSQLPVLASTNIWVGNGSSAATAVAVSGDAALANTGALTVTAVGGSTAANLHAAELLANASTSSNTASTIVKRDVSGDFSAGTITATLSGSATNFSGSLVGDVTGTQGATVVATVGTSSAANVHAAELLANAATNSNTVSTLVKRDASGNFAAGTITASLTGNVTGNLTGNVTGNVSGSSGSFTGSLVGDVTGNQGATVVSTVGTSSAANVHTAELAANAATNANTVSTVVKRDSSGNFSAGTITASLTGTASGNTTYTPNNHGLVLSGSANAMTVVAPDASTTKTLISGGSSADPAWGTLAIGGGGTGQTTANAAFGALSPLSTKGDVVVFSTINTRIGVGSNGQVLTADSTQATGVKWAPAGAASLTVVSKTGNYTLQTTDYYVLNDDSGGSFTLTLPTAVGVSGQTYVVKKVVASTNTVSLATTSSQTIDGYASSALKLATNGESYTLVSDGANWVIANHKTNTAWATAAFTVSAGFGTTTNKSIWWRRVGDTMQVRGRWTDGTVAGSEGNVTMPTGYAIDTTKLNATQNQDIGTWQSVSNGTITPTTAHTGPCFTDGSSTSTVWFAYETSSDVFAKENGSAIAVSNKDFVLKFEVPITNWSE